MGVGGGGVAERPVGGDGRLRGEERGVRIVRHREVQLLARLVGGAGRDVVREAAHGLRARVLVYRRRVSRNVEAWRVVHGVHRDGEALRRTGVGAAVGRAAAVLGPNRDGGLTVGVGRRRVAERPVGRNLGLSREQGLVVIADYEAHCLGGLIRRTSRDRGRPWADRLRSGVLVDRLVGALGEAWRVVYGVDLDVDCRSLHGALVRAAVVADGVLEGRIPDEIGRRREGDVTALAGEAHSAAGGAGDLGDAQFLGGLVGRALVVVGHEVAGGEGQGLILEGALGVALGNRCVVHGTNRQVDRASGCPALTVGDGVGERVGAVEVGGRVVGERTIVVDSQLAVGRRGVGRHGQAIPVDVGIVAEHTRGSDGKGLVLVGGPIIVLGQRCIVYGVDRDVDRGRVGVGAGVLGLVGEGVRAVVVGGRRVTDLARVGAGGDDLGGAVSRIAQAAARHAEAVALDVCVVGQHVYDLGRVLVGFGRVVYGYRRVVDSVDPDVDRDGIAVGGAVAGLVGEGIAAVEVGGRVVAKRTVGVERQPAVGRPGHLGRREVSVVDVVVVAEHTRGSDVQRGVLVGVVAVALGHRRVVYGGDRHVDPTRRRPTVAVGDSVGEGIGAVGVGIRIVLEGAVSVLAHRTLRRLGEVGDAQAIALFVGVVGYDVYVGSRVLVGGLDIVNGDRSVVDRADRDVDGGGVGPALAVADLEGERVVAVEVVVGRVGLVIPRAAERAVRRARLHAVGEAVAVDVGAGQGDLLGRVLVGRD